MQKAQQQIPKYPVRDRDYLLDKAGFAFKVTGDNHPDGYYLGYVKYYPNPKGHRQMFDKNYSQNTLVSNSFGLLANSPSYYTYSDQVGSVVTGVPHQNIVRHYSCRQGLKDVYTNREKISRNPAGKVLADIVQYIYSQDIQHLFGVTGSFLLDCFNENSDIDLVCYGSEGLRQASRLFKNNTFIKPYAGNDLPNLYARRVKYTLVNDYDRLIKQEKRKLQGLTKEGKIHINCEPLRSDNDPLIKLSRKVHEVGEMQLIAKITSHQLGVFTPSTYQIEVLNVIDSTINDAQIFSKKISLLISYLGAYTLAFKKGDVVHVNGKLIHIQSGDKSEFGIELSPWTRGAYYSASLIN